MVSAHYTIIFNPSAGKAAMARVDRLVAYLQKLGHYTTLYCTQAPFDATRYLQKQANSMINRVIAVGGDGTVREVIAGLVDHPNAILGILPAGTINLATLGLQYPKSDESIFSLLAQANYRTTPVFSVGNTYGLLMIGVGFDALSVKTVNPVLKKHIGKFAYAVSMLRQWFTFGKHRYLIEADGQRYEGYSAIITHSALYGDSYPISQRVSLKDRHLHVLIFKTNSRLELLRAMLAIMTGRIEQCLTVHSMLAQRVLISPLGNDTCVQIDGDACLCLPVDIAIGSRYINMITPYEAAQAIPFSVIDNVA